MRRFLLEVSAFVALQGVVGGMIWRACPRREDHYAAATGDKRRLLEACASPRLIFVGGSSAAFGFDSRVVARAGLNPVNMGHNRSLGLEFMLGQVRDALGAGDIVVVSPEHELLWRSGVDSTLVTHLEYDPPSLAAVDLETGRRLLDRGLPWVAGKLRCALHQVSDAPPVGYTRYSFDDTGDFATHRGKPPLPHEVQVAPWPRPEALQLDSSLASLAEFAARCEDVGARCVYAFAPMRRGQFEANEETARHLETAVRTRSGMEVVIGVDAAVFEHAEYFDMGPHLVPAAAAERTEALVRSLLEGAPGPT